MGQGKSKSESEKINQRNCGNGRVDFFYGTVHQNNQHHAPKSGKKNDFYHVNSYREWSQPTIVRAQRQLDQSRQLNQQQGHQQHHKKQQHQKKVLTKAECSVCGHEGHASARCHHRKQTCNICGRVGHLASVCREKKHHPDSVYKPKAAKVGQQRYQHH